MTDSNDRLGERITALAARFDHLEEKVQFEAGLRAAVDNDSAGILIRVRSNTRLLEAVADNQRELLTRVARLEDGQAEQRKGTAEILRLLNHLIQRGE